MCLKKFGYFFNRNVIGCLESTFGGVEQLTDLAVFPLFEVSQLEHHPLHIRQRGYRLLQQRLSLGAIKIVISQQVAGNGLHIVDTDTLMLVTTKKIQTLVNGYTR